ncbi:MAG: helix-turn-helix domain-containing protein [Gammaproteobacteria bacterium]|nr:helix-turn-helix domain-containing protein [Gammaproteobacteria bacterium]
MTTYNPNNFDAPGSTVFRMREKLGWSQRRLAQECNPEIDHTTIRRVEHNNGYTQDTLERIASAFSRGYGRRLTVADLFIHPKIAEFNELPDAVQDRIAQGVHEAAIAYRFTKPKAS